MPVGRRGLSDFVRLPNDSLFFSRLSPIGKPFQQTVIQRLFAKIAQLVEREEIAVIRDPAGQPVQPLQYAIGHLSNAEEPSEDWQAGRFPEQHLDELVLGQRALE